jgi:ABC-type glycerol-3-phosphate transport system permease component
MQYLDAMEDSSNYNNRGVDPDARQFLKKILNSTSATLLWLLVNMTAGLFGGYALIDQKISIINIAFYAWLLLSLGLLIFYLRRLWTKK